MSRGTKVQFFFPPCHFCFCYIIIIAYLFVSIFDIIAVFLWQIS